MTSAWASPHRFTTILQPDDRRRLICACGRLDVSVRSADVSRVKLQHTRGERP